MEKAKLIYAFKDISARKYQGNRLSPIMKNSNYQNDMGSPEKIAMQEILSTLRARKSLAEHKLQATHSNYTELEWNVRRLQGRIAILEEMIKTTEQ